MNAMGSADSRTVIRPFSRVASQEKAPDAPPRPYPDAHSGGEDAENYLMRMTR